MTDGDINIPGNDPVRQRLFISAILIVLAVNVEVFEMVVFVYIKEKSLILSDLGIERKLGSCTLTIVDI